MRTLNTKVLSTTFPGAVSCANSVRFDVQIYFSDRQAHVVCVCDVPTREVTLDLKSIFMESE